MTIKVLRSFALCFGDLAGARTQDPIIKSDVLYQLSYEIAEYQHFPLVVQIYGLYFNIPNILASKIPP